MHPSNSRSSQSLQRLNHQQIALLPFNRDGEADEPTAEPSKLQEPATDSEDEGEGEEEGDEGDDDDDDESSNEEATSSSKRRAVKTGARSRVRKSNIHSLESITFSQLEEKDKKGAQRVLVHYKDDGRQGCVNLCGHFMSGKCRYMSKSWCDKLLFIFLNYLQSVRGDSKTFK